MKLQKNIKLLIFTKKKMKLIKYETNYLHHFHLSSQHLTLLHFQPDFGSFARHFIPLFFHLNSLHFNVI